MSKAKLAVSPIFARGMGAYVTLSLISLFCAIPFLWLILASFDGNASLFLRWPNPWTLNNYIGIFVREGGARWFFNSFLVVGTATIIVLVFASYLRPWLFRASVRRAFLHSFPRGVISLCRSSCCLHP